MSLAVAAPLLLANTLSLAAIVDNAGRLLSGFIPHWNIFQMPLPQIFSFIIFLIAAFAETNRMPFDLPEAENELVAGFHTEYSSMKFASFFMAEYANMVTVCSVATLLFLGGWQPLWPAPYGRTSCRSLVSSRCGVIAVCITACTRARWDQYHAAGVRASFSWSAGRCLSDPSVAAVLLPLFWFPPRPAPCCFFFIWIRATLPRFRYDQLMGFAWKFLFPVAVLNLLVTGFMVALFPG